MSFFRILADIFISYKTYNRTVNELKSLSDIELKDIGIDRCDIYKIAAERSF